MISVILPVYNEPLDFIEQSLGSITNQTYQDLEILVIDDNPIRKDLLSFLRRKQSKDKRIKLVINETNLGLTASLNKAIDLANGNYVARMDADDISDPTRLKKQLNLLNQENLDLVGCSIVDIDENGKEITGKTIKRPTTDKNIKKFLRYNSAIFHPTWLGKTELFKNYKYIDFPACEDYEFLTRIAIDGKKLGNINETLLRYRNNRNGISNSKKILQKTSFLYISQNYKKKRQSRLKDFERYLDGPNSIEAQKKLEEYYTTTRKLKEMVRKRRYCEFIVIAVKELTNNPIARHLSYNSVRSKQLIAQEEKTQ